MGVLKLLRNKHIYADRPTALSSLQKQFDAIRPGEGQVIIATYGSSETDGTAKTIFGIKHLNGVTYFDAEVNEEKINSVIETVVNSLTKNDSATDYNFVTSVSQDKGIISVTRGGVTSNDRTINLKPNDDGGVDFGVNVDGLTITKNETDGSLSVASSALTQYVGDGTAINVSGVDEANNEKTISLVIPEDEKVLSKDANGLKTTLTIVKNTNPSDSNVKEEYYLQGKTDGETLGEAIKIYKDASLLDVKLLHSSTDTKPTYNKINGWTDISEDIRTEVNLALCFAYETSNGGITVESIPVGNFLRESEFKDGLQVNQEGEVSILKDTLSEKVITEYGDTNTESDVFTVSDKGIKIANIQKAIDAAVSNSNSKLDSIIYSSGTNETEYTSATDNVKTKIVQTDGKLTSVEIVTNDIASAKELSDEISHRKAVDGIDGDVYKKNETATYINNAESLNDADIILDSVLNVIEDSMLINVEAGDGISVTEKEGNKQTISIKLDYETSPCSYMNTVDEEVYCSPDNMLQLTRSGLYLSSIIDEGEY